MMIKSSTKNAVLTVSFLFGITLVFPVCALEWEFGVNGSSLYTDNARRVPDEQAAISERQDSLGLGLGAIHNSSGVNFNADYVMAYTVFTEDSQQDRQTKSGRSSLLLGKASDLFNLELEHSVQLTLFDPSEVAILENLGERSISTARPSINFRVSPVDYLNIGGIYSDIRYKEQPIRDSTREGINSEWTHLLSQTKSLVLIASREDVEFESFPESSYTVKYLMLGYEVSLRKLRYSLYVGSNKSDSESSSFSDGRYSFDLTYNTISSQFGFHVSKELTDSSLGNGNQLALGDDVAFGDPQGGVIETDQIDLAQAEIFWSSGFMCIKCNFTASYRFAEEEYLLFSDQNNKQINAAVGIGYQMNTRNNVRLLLNSSDRTFTDLPELDSEQVQIALTYNYQVNQNLFLRVSASKIKLDYINRGVGDIPENQYAVGFEYNF